MLSAVAQLIHCSKYSVYSLLNNLAEAKPCPYIYYKKYGPVHNVWLPLVKYVYLQDTHISFYVLLSAHAIRNLMSIDIL